MTRSLVLAAAAVAMFTLAGCSSSDDDDSDGSTSPLPGVGDQDNDQGADTPDGGPTDMPGNGDMTEPGTLIEGEWESACSPALPDSQALGDRVVLSIVERVFTLTETSYGDLACSSAQRTLATRGSFVELGPEDGQELDDGFPVDLNISQHTLTPLLVQVSNEYNANALCDSTEWVPGVERDVSDCAALFGTATAPRTDYNRFFLDNQMTVDVRSDDVLFLGALEPIINESDRPAQVSQELRFTRRAP